MASIKRKAVLDGIRVIDFSQTRTGAQASQLLADFGSDIIHIETPTAVRCLGKRPSGPAASTASN